MRSNTISRLISVALITLLALGWSARKLEAGSAYEIDAAVRATLDQFYFEIASARELAGKSYGVLVLPSVVKAGFGFGGEYGEGALLVRGQPPEYYNTLSASFGLQLGVQAKSVT